MSKTPETGAPLSPLHDLLSAIVDTLDVPLAATFDDDRSANQLLRARAAQLRGYLQSMVEERREIQVWHPETIREMTTATPVTYPAYTRADAGASQ